MADKMRLRELTITRKQWGLDEGKLLGEIAFENQYSKVSVKLNEDQAYRILEVVQDALVVSAHETAALLVADLQRPQAQIVESENGSPTPE